MKLNYLKIGGKIWYLYKRNEITTWEALNYHLGNARMRMKGGKTELYEKLQNIYNFAIVETRQKIFCRGEGSNAQR